MWKIINTYLLYTIPMISVFMFGKIVINKQHKIFTIKNIIIFNAITILQAICSTTFNGTIKSLIMFFNNIVLYKLLFKISFSKSIILALLYMILLIIPEMIEIYFMTKIIHISKNYVYNTFAGSIIGNISISLLFLGITYLIRKLLRKLIDIKIEENTKITIYFILTFTCIVMLFYKSFANIKLDINFVASIFVMIVFFVILFSLIKQTLTNNKIKEEYDKLLEFMTTYENEIEKQRILRHETKNEFLAIRAKLCDNQKNKEIIGYIDEILKDKIKVKQEAYAKFGYLPANGIKGLCYFKAQVAEEKGIQVSLNISKRIKDSSIYKLSTKEQREFGRILGVILDNAIEASNNSENKQIGIEAYTTSDKNCKMIISNTFDGEIDKNKIGKERFSTKGKNRGHGLLLVKHIINENKIFELNTTVQNNVYTQIISIKKV